MLEKLFRLNSEVIVITDTKAIRQEVGGML